MALYKSSNKINGIYIKIRTYMLKLLIFLASLRTEEKKSTLMHQRIEGNYHMKVTLPGIKNVV
jgi:hypothetical protein